MGSVKSGDGESREIALFKADVNLASGVVSGELGGVSADARIPAVIQRGACTGPWTKVEGPAVAGAFHRDGRNGRSSE